MECPRCHATNAPNAAFCAQCGLPFSASPEASGASPSSPATGSADVGRPWLESPESASSRNAQVAADQATAPTSRPLVSSAISVTETATETAGEDAAEWGEDSSETPPAPDTRPMAAPSAPTRSTKTWPLTGRKASRRQLSTTARPLPATPSVPLAASQTTGRANTQPVLDPDWTGGRQSFAPEIAAPRAQRRWGRWITILVIVVILLVTGFVTRTAIHLAVDSQLALVMTSSVQAISSLTNTSQTYSVTEDTVNSEIKANLPSGYGVDRVVVAMNPNKIVVTYSGYGQTGTITTGLAVQSGKIVLVQTQAQGIVGWVETGNELAQTADQALAKLPTPYGVESVEIQQGAVMVTLKPPSKSS